MNDYLDPDLPIERRVEDLLPRMTISEKAGLLFHPTAEPGGGSPTEGVLIDAERNLLERGITHFTVRRGADSAVIAEWHNTLQDLAASTRLGIPITLSSGPRHRLRSLPSTGEWRDSFSRWPEAIGFAAIAGTETVREYADIIRRDFLAMGIRVYLGPVADILSEPRWSRGSSTFGEDPERVAALTVAFIEGLRGGALLGSQSVAAVVQHFPGSGPQLHGHDPHHPEQVYPGGMQEVHLEPFVKAFAAGATQVMTSSGKPVGTDWGGASFAFNDRVVRGVLRDRLGFAGIVVTDGNVLQSAQMDGLAVAPHGRGVERLSSLDRARIAMEVGVDQFGGDHDTTIVDELVDSGKVTEERIDQSVRRLLREKFRLGLFEKRHVDAAREPAAHGAPVFFARGAAAQGKAIVLLADDAGIMSPAARVFVDGVYDTSGLTTTTTLSDAEAIIVRVDAPFDVGPGSVVAGSLHGGSLAFSPRTLDRLRLYASHAPLYLAVFLERPAILTPLLGLGATIIGEFGATDAVVVDAFTGRASVTGTLPFDIPRSVGAVEDSREDVPFDTVAPLFCAGYGIARGARRGVTVR